MNPSIVNILEDNHNIRRFTLINANVSLANAIRRTLLTEIPVVCIRTENETLNQCRISVNTGRLHNEILKHRLSMIPIHETDLTRLPGKWELVVDVRNDTDEILYVTSGDFKLRRKSAKNDNAQKDQKDDSEESGGESGGEWMSEQEVRRIFPPCLLPGDTEPEANFVDFARLRPSPNRAAGFPGEQLSLVADFSVARAKDNAMFNVVSKSAYGCTLDVERKNAKLAELVARWKSEGLTEEEIRFQVQNFEVLDAQRYFQEDSFDFQVQTIGVYTNEDLVHMALRLLWKKFAVVEGEKENLWARVVDGCVKVIRSPCTIPGCWDVLLEGEDDTFGRLLEFVVYDTWFMKSKTESKTESETESESKPRKKTVTYCGFKKFHPHDTYSVLRLAVDLGIGGTTTTTTTEDKQDEDKDKDDMDQDQDQGGEEKTFVLHILKDVCEKGAAMMSQLLPGRKTGNGK